MTDSNGSSSGKDFWDKVGTLTTPFATLVVAAVGTYATWSFNDASLDQKRLEAVTQQNQQQLQFKMEQALRLQQHKDQKALSDAQALQQLFAFVSSSEPQRREFGYAMFAAMGQEQLALKLIDLKKDRAGLAVVRSLAKNEDLSISSAANASLASLENASSVGTVVLRERSSCRNFAAAGFRMDRTPLQDSDIVTAATKLNVEPAALRAFLKVETRDRTLADGRPSILFERQIFSRLTEGRFDSAHPDISAKRWGGYKGGIGEYDRLTKAAGLNCPAALAATSWGTFKIMGRSYKEAGYTHVDDYIKDVMSSGSRELAAGIKFMQSLNLIEPLQNKDWDTVARRYNGPNAAQNDYPRKLALAYADATGAPTETGQLQASNPTEAN